MQEHIGTIILLALSVTITGYNMIKVKIREIESNKIENQYRAIITR